MTAPQIDDLLLAHLEYAAWATKRTLAMLDRLPAEAITRPSVSSFPSILATMQHLYQADRYYFILLQGGSCPAVDAVIPPATYDALRVEVPALHEEMLRWARAHLAAGKNVVLHGWGDWPVWMVVMQIANHMTHHVGQVLTLARQAGCVPEFSDWTDLIQFHLRRFPVDVQSVSPSSAAGEPRLDTR